MLSLLVALSAPRLEPLMLPDLAGKTVQVLPTKAKRGLVAFFVLSECPIANGYAPEMKRLAGSYAAKGFQFRLVYVDHEGDVKALARHWKSYAYNFPALVDRKLQLTKFTGAARTPEAAVFSPRGDLLYRGRIDDLYPTLGQRRKQARVHDLRDALDAILAGKPIKKPRTTVVGCFIPTN